MGRFMAATVMLLCVGTLQAGEPQSRAKVALALAVASVAQADCHQDEPRRERWDAARGILWRYPVPGEEAPGWYHDMARGILWKVPVVGSAAGMSLSPAGMFSAGTYFGGFGGAFCGPSG